MAPYTLPDLSYDYGALEPHYSGEIVELHHSKHHAAYVKGANDTLEQLEEARSEGDYDTLGMLEKSLAFHLSGHVLHSIFWTNMAPDGGGEPDGELAAAIDDAFGGFQRFRSHLSAATLSVQGVGWGALAWEPISRRLVIEQVYDHQGNIGQSTLPLLVIDVWEHAFYLQYRNVKADWVDAFWQIVNWSDVARRFEAARAVPSPIL